MVTADAHAAEPFGIKLSQSSFLSDGQGITIKVNNLPADKGIYVTQCLLVKGLPSQNRADCTSQSNAGSSLWVSTSPGGANPSAPQSFTVLRNIGSNDCAKVTCGIVTSRDHVDFSDRSFDSVTPISLSPVKLSVSKTADLVDAGDKVSVTLSGLDADKGVYVRLCQIPADGSRPSSCDDPGAVWATNLAAELTQGAVDASKAFDLRVKGYFFKSSKLIDCQIVQCGVFIERDWHNFGDHTIDALVPVTFSQATIQDQTVNTWKFKPGKTTLKVGKTLVLAPKSAKSVQGTLLTWKTNSNKVCKVATTKTALQIQALSAGECVVTAQAKSGPRLNAASFTWSIKIAK